MEEVKKNPLHWIFPCRLYQTDEKLFIGLAREETQAIQCLLQNVESSVSKMMKQLELRDELLNEILHDGMLILLNKIKSDQFQTERSSPKTYLISICKNLCLNASRLKHHLLTDPLDEQLHEYPTLEDADLGIGDKLKLLKRMLEELGSPCKELIYLKYISELSDEEQIKENRTSYKNADSLRVSRSQCMKKLLALSNKYKSSYAQL
ncbi:MAG: hypothetical protein IPM92_14540 [Saprospiraceae bacterium]|nr:hypothetical protein [Saprospiraceae bacterium]